MRPPKLGHSRLRALACPLVVLLLLASAHAQVAIEGPETVEPGVPAWFSISASDGQSASFFPSDDLTIGPPHLAEGHALFWTRQPGRYSVMGIAVDWNRQTFSIVQKRIVVGEGDDPDPPPPPPTPGERHLVILYESDTAGTATVALANLLMRLRVDSMSGYLAEKKHRLTIADQDGKSPDGTAHPVLARYRELVDGPLPYLFVVDKEGRVRHKGPCPVEFDAVIAIVTKTGG